MRGRPAGAGKAFPQQSASRHRHLPTRPGGLLAPAWQHLTGHCRGCGLAEPHGRERPWCFRPPPLASPPAGRARTVCGHHFKAGVHLHHGAFVEHVCCVQASAVASRSPLVLRTAAWAASRPPSRSATCPRPTPKQLSGVTPSATCASEDAFAATSSLRCVPSRTDAAAEQQAARRPHGALLGSPG